MRFFFASATRQARRACSIFEASGSALVERPARFAVGAGTAFDFLPRFDFFSGLHVKGVKFLKLDRFLGYFRCHADAKSATMQDVIDAFSVEKLNKEFFADFSAAFERVKSEIEKRDKWKEKVAKEEAQTLLNRLLFLYFVQRKGWLNRKRDYLHSNFERFKDDAASKTTFLDGFLRPLFTKLSTEGSQADISGHDQHWKRGGN